MHLRELVRQGRADANATLRKSADYLQTHQRPIRSHRLRLTGRPVGSGVVEGVCYHATGVRLKRKSARWNKPGAPRVLHLRLERLSVRWPLRLQVVGAVA